MKRLILMLALLLPIALSAQSEGFKELCDTFSGTDGFTTIEMSGQMLKLVNGSSSANKEMNTMLNNVKKLIIIVSEEGSERFEKMIDKAVDTDHYELMTSVKDGTDNVKIYSIAGRDQKEPNDFVIRVNDGTSSVLILVSGKLTLKDVGQLAKISVN